MRSSDGNFIFPSDDVLWKLNFQLFPVSIVYSLPLQELAEAFPDFRERPQQLKNENRGNPITLQNPCAENTSWSQEIDYDSNCLLNNMYKSIFTPTIEKRKILFGFRCKTTPNFHSNYQSETKIETSKGRPQNVLGKGCAVNLHLHDYFTDLLLDVL